MKHRNHILNTIGTKYHQFTILNSQEFQSWPFQLKVLSFSALGTRLFSHIPPCRHRLSNDDLTRRFQESSILVMVHSKKAQVPHFVLVGTGKEELPLDHPGCKSPLCESQGRCVKNRLKQWLLMSTIMGFLRTSHRIIWKRFKGWTQCWRYIAFTWIQHSMSPKKTCLADNYFQHCLGNPTGLATCLRWDMAVPHGHSCPRAAVEWC